MRNKTPVFLLTVKNSLREKQIKKRLKFLGIVYKTFYAIDAKISSNHKILNKIFDIKKCKYVMGRPMNFVEISNAECHLRIYKYILSKNILNAIVMEDDCYPYKFFKKWLDLDNVFSKKNFDVIQLYHSFGLVFKKPEMTINKKFFLHKTCFTLPYTTCYQISLKACKYILKRNKKIFRTGDWSINFSEKQLTQFACLPRIVTLCRNHESTSSQANIWKRYKKIELIKKYFPFYDVFSNLYYLLHIPFFLRIYKDYNFFKEVYWFKNYYFFENFLFNKYLNLKYKKSISQK
jgi:GR25 family glycosyltransferase involved in LPS biosynthesis